MSRDVDLRKVVDYELVAVSYRSVTPRMYYPLYSSLININSRCLVHIRFIQV